MTIQMLIIIHFVREIYFPSYVQINCVRVVNYKMNGDNLHFELNIGNASFVIYVGVMAAR